MKLLTLLTGLFIVMGATVQSAQATNLQQTEEYELFTATNQPQLYCLAMNIYHEARAESLAGQFAVADVTLNRVKDTRYPGSICDVVMQAKMKESWKTRQHSHLQDSERVYYPIRNMIFFRY